MTTPDAGWLVADSVKRFPCRRRSWTLRRESLWRRSLFGRRWVVLPKTRWLLNRRRHRCPHRLHWDLSGKLTFMYSFNSSLVAWPNGYDLNLASDVPQNSYILKFPWVNLLSMRRLWVDVASPLVSLQVVGSKSFRLFEMPSPVKAQVMFILMISSTNGVC